MNIFVVIPNWNGADLLAECLDSLKSQTQANTIIVVDNGSVDNSVELIEKNYPDVVLIKNPKNLGFAGGVNAGIRYALENRADAIALFNNDAIASKDWLKSLAQAIATTNAGIVTCKLMRSDKKYFDSTGDFYSVYGIGFPRGRNCEDIGQYNQAEEVFGASGGASLYSANMLKEIGLFDERFFAYFEDVDISFRAQLAGWKVFYEPSSVAYHHVSATSSKLGNFSRYHSIKNFLIIYTKNMPAALYWKYLPKYLYQFVRTAARSVVNFQLHIWLKALIVFLTYLPGILKDRFQIQRSRRISVAGVDALLYKERPPVIPDL